MELKNEEVLAKRQGKLIYRSGEYCVKLFDENYSKANVLNEALNQARVEETNLNIPKIIEVCKIDGKWAIVLEHIKGKNLAQLMAEHPEKENEYLEQFVNLQILVHKQEAPLLNRIRDKMKRKLAEADLDATTRYDLQMRLESLPRYDKVCHGDFNPSNVIIAEDGKEYIIDWAHATQGNTLEDVARTFLMFSLDGKDDLAKKYIDLFCKKNDIAKQLVQQWIPIVAASQSV
ncbi:MAG: aminoglycoside phosphotransferase family protein, partial [Spirochaetales bacterium]|nr:aminoglycoside phosphotransferase family protein [Spirochaetales bacterium]